MFSKSVNSFFLLRPDYQSSRYGEFSYLDGIVRKIRVEKFDSAQKNDLPKENEIFSWKKLSFKLSKASDGLRGFLEAFLML